MDFAYKEICFGDYPDYFSWGQDENFISIRSNSKWCRGLGRRLGWIEAPKYVIDSFESLQNSTILSPDRLHQMALTDYINSAIADNSLVPYVNEIRALYKETAEVTINAINKYLGLPCLIPDGGLYTCIRVDKNSAEFVEEVLKGTGVLFVPGWGFGKTVSHSVRLSYGPLVYQHRTIEKGLEKVGKFLKK
jgi:aspartate/methionine/tyrosine aminotransferase